MTATATPPEAPAPTTDLVKGRTTEDVLRTLLTSDQDPLPVIAALVARFDARAIRREAKASAE
jgi:hypothetical protein